MSKVKSYCGTGSPAISQAMLCCLKARLLHAFDKAIVLVLIAVLINVDTACDEPNQQTIVEHIATK